MNTITSDSSPITRSASDVEKELRLSRTIISWRDTETQRAFPPIPPTHARQTLASTQPTEDPYDSILSRIVSRDYTSARADLEALLEQPGTDHRRSLLLLGYLEVYAGNYDRGSDLLMRAFEMSPSDSIALLELSVAQAYMGHFHIAQVLLEETASLMATNGTTDFDRAMLHKAMGDLSFSLGDYELAVTQLEEARQLLPETAPSSLRAYIHTEIGISCYELSAFPKARRQFARALELARTAKPGDPLVLGIVLGHNGLMARRDSRLSEAELFYEEALDTLNRHGLSSHPETGMILNNLGALYFQNKDYSRARAFHRRALDLWKQTLGEKNPEIARSLINIGSTYARQDQHALAIDHYLAAMELLESVGLAGHNNYVVAMVNHATSLARSGQPQQALVIYREAIEICTQRIGPTHLLIAKAQEGLAEVYSTLKQPGQARLCAELAIEFWKQEVSPDAKEIGIIQNKFSTILKPSTQSVSESNACIVALPQ